MAISVITYSSLGQKISISTPDILPVIKEFSAGGELEQVVCYTNRNFSFPRTYSAIPLPLHYLFRIAEKYFKIKISRFFYEKIFDWSASLRLRPSEIVLFHGGHFLRRTLEKASKAGSVTVDIPRLAHPNTNARLEKEELINLGLESRGGYHEKMSLKYNHSNKFDYIIASSDFVKKSYIEAGYPADKIYLANFDIDFSRFDVKEPHDKTKIFKVLYMAYTTPLKGLHYLLEAWEELRLPNVELTLVGGFDSLPNKLRERYEKIIARNKNIVVVGHTPNPEEYYKDASLFVFPSLTESYGRVTLEAMACGVPIITTENAQGIVEDGKTGFVVPIRDSRMIKEKIEYLYHNPEIRKKMGVEARVAVENKKPFGKSVYDICQEIIGKHQTN
ncbi:MAG: glycosyltransferase [Candidatus Paceibacterota bacterium]|jgi:glycosyltransferase involved in cell wall biosynthesis